MKKVLMPLSGIQIIKIISSFMTADGIHHYKISIEDEANSIFDRIFGFKYHAIITKDDYDKMIDIAEIKETIRKPTIIRSAKIKKI